MRTERDVWEIISPEDIWVMDKLILSRTLGYICGPSGMDVPNPGWYIVRPCVNIRGLGLGAEKTWLDRDTHNLPIGSFWCEWFEGRHISVDYDETLQIMAVEGFKEDHTFRKWDRWIKVSDQYPLPEFLRELSIKYAQINCEFIGDKLIEVHFRLNPDFEGGITEFIPIFGENILDLESQGYTWIDTSDENNRIGAWVKYLDSL